VKLRGGRELNISNGSDGPNCIIAGDLREVKSPARIFVIILVVPIIADAPPSTDERNS
jgi:hypothetical protein